MVRKRNPGEIDDDTVEPRRRTNKGEAENWQSAAAAEFDPGRQRERRSPHLLPRFHSSSSSPSSSTRVASVDSALVPSPVASHRIPLASSSSTAASSRPDPAEFDPVGFLASLQLSSEFPLPPSTTAPYAADFASLPADYQALENPHLPRLERRMPQPRSPPLVPSALPRVPSHQLPVSSSTSSSSSSLYSMASDPLTAYSTPALTSDSMSVGPSQDPFIATTPASHASPEFFLSPESSTHHAMSFSGEHEIDDGRGLGLEPLDYVDPTGGRGGTAEWTSKPPAQVSPMNVEQVPSPVQQVPPARPLRPAPPEIPRKGVDIGLSLADFDMLDTLGTGTFGKVLLARLRTSPSRPSQHQPLFFAMKVLEKNTVVRLRQVEHVNSERSTLALIQHPFIVNLFCTFQDEQNLYLLLEYVQGGELFSHLRRAGRFSADVTRFYIANLVLALEHLHRQDIIYRDLKPENLLIGADGHLKVTDFGFAKFVPDRTYTLCGTPEYLAPEIITATGHGAAADWWALGILLFELLAGYPPFFADNPLEIYEKILTGKFQGPNHVDPVAKDLIRRLLTADLTKRLGNLSGGAEDVKMHRWFEGVDWEAVRRKEIRAPIIPLTHIPGDSSNFERFPVTDPTTMPGIFRAMSERKYGFAAPMGPDPYGYLFPLF
ncbi:hypothetical protein JCM10212_006703 [Sporobolomyces blumeae]